MFIICSFWLMPVYAILILCILGILLVTAVPYFVINLLVGYFVYINILKRGVHDDWGRHCSGPEPEMVYMFDKGLEWQKTVAGKKKDVQIVNDGLKLYGEYYDFGSEDCLIFLPGRMESLQYSYFFAQPYAKAGYNVLVIDSRAHGLSDGVFNTVGFEESKDAIAWAKYVHEQLGIKKVLFHGICIGSAAGMLATTSEDCPEYVVGLVADGMYANFGLSMEKHLIERNKPTKPTLQMINFWMKHYTHHDMYQGPADSVGQFRKKLLMLHSKTDFYSSPENAQKMFDLCPAKEKKLVWFDDAKHSMLRYKNPEKYDAEVLAFAEKSFSDVENA